MENSWIYRRAVIVVKQLQVSESLLSYGGSNLDNQLDRGKQFPRRECVGMRVLDLIHLYFFKLFLPSTYKNSDFKKSMSFPLIYISCSNQMFQLKLNGYEYLLNITNLHHAKSGECSSPSIVFSTQIVPPSCVFLHFRRHGVRG